MQAVVLSVAVVLLLLLSDWGAARNAEAVVRNYALAFDPQIHGLVGDEQLPHAPDPPSHVVAALEEVRRTNPEYARRVSGIILLKLHHFYLVCCRQSYEIRRFRNTRPENVFVAAFLARPGPPVRREFIPSAEAAEWAESIESGPLLEEIRTNLAIVRERRKLLDEEFAREKREWEVLKAEEWLDKVLAGEKEEWEARFTEKEVIYLCSGTSEHTCGSDGQSFQNSSCGYMVCWSSRDDAETTKSARIEVPSRSGIETSGTVAGPQRPAGEFATPSEPVVYLDLASFIGGTPMSPRRDAAP